MVAVKKEGIILEKTDFEFENEGVLNPAVIREGDSVHLFYRAVRNGNNSTLGYCRLDGPVTVAERWNKPFMVPEFDYETQGVEDARIVKKELTKEFWGKYFLTMQEDIVLDPIYAHESSYIGSGCPPIETKHGLLLIYHGAQNTDQGPVYSACAALLDLNDPSKEIARLPYALFSPEYDWEKYGEVNNVVFPTGTALFGGTLFIYYGAADERIACASVSLSELVAELLTYTKKNEK
jgi:predicted GH43/DUF377 family glycosyl hydrolase